MAGNQELRVLGQTIEQLEDCALEARVRPPTSERLAALYQARAERALSAERRAWARPVAVLACAAAVLLGISLRGRPLGFVVGAARTPGELGVWVQAAAQNELLAFSDGSRVSLAPGAQARVVSTTVHGAHIAIERGSVRSDVVPRRGNDWSVLGGPFEIQVTGTSFDASWQPETQTLSVSMYEGHVLVRAACLREPRALGKGESASLTCAREPGSAAPAPSVTSERSAPPSAVPADSPGAKPTQPLNASSASATPVAAASSAQVDAAARNWRELAAHGAYPAALSAAEQEGFEQACAALGSTDLLELGTVARLAGNVARAGQAYRALRARFPGNEDAASAAFHLGQMAFDHAGAYGEARTWFATYLAERPAGALAAEALGREMEAEQRAGDSAAARATAQSYLKRFPSGAHARLAQSLVAP